MARHLCARVILSAVDIGTNTVLLLVADVDSRGVPQTVSEAQRTPRIGRQMDAGGVIPREAFVTIAEILRGYGAISASSGALKISCCATSAVRNAANRLEFIEYLRMATGMVVEIVDGITEGELTYRGVTAGSPHGGMDPVVLDIGGGSTEICYAIGGESGRTQHLAGVALERYSLETGSVRLTERFFGTLPPSKDRIADARAAMCQYLRDVPADGLAGRTLIGVAGTPTTLACINMGLSQFDRRVVEGHRLRRKTVSSLAEKLLAMGPGQVRSLSDATEGREDILPAGALMLETIMDHLGSPELTVSTRGLRYGIVMRDWERLKETG